MPTIRTALLALFAAGLAIAADPFVGTWKPDLSRWRDGPGAPEGRKSQLLKWEAAGSDRYRVTTLASDGKPVSSVDVFLDGKEHQASDADNDLGTAQRLSATSIRVSVRGTKGATLISYIVSAGGRVLTVSRKGTGTTSGRQIDEIHVYDKQ
jgi:hypothetical protein